MATALPPLTVIEAAKAEEESLAIAVALREAVHDGKTAALVTPDRALGRRVLAALKRWNIAAEDSGGDALAETPAGIFARLAAETALHGFAPVTLLALLKHPLLRLDRSGTDDAVATLERAILRGPRPRAGTRGLAHALKALRETKDRLHPSDPRRALTDAELAAAGDLLTRLGEALKPFESLGRTRLPLSDMAARHRAVLAALSRQGKDEAAFAGRDGTILADALDELAASPAAARLLVEPLDYLELFSAALAGRVVRRPVQPGLRVRILGPLEARLT
jgi:ATP-dependent helicase/nuclease subunit B